MNGEPPRNDRIRTLFAEAVNLGPQERLRYLEHECGADSGLRLEVEGLLGAFDTKDWEVHQVLRSLGGPDEPERPGAHEAGRQDPHELLGSNVAQYEIREWCGGGGMGVVYKAFDTRLARYVALKFLPKELSQDALAKDRLVDEARTASRLDHANICTVHEIGETEQGQVFLAMTFYDGETLKKKLAAGPLPFDDALQCSVDVARGLSHAHAEGIVHRDIKPANLMVTRDGTVKILDFGIAQTAALMDRRSQGLGTPGFASPEQLRGEALDQRSDIWSLGVVMYQLFTGQRPFEGAREEMVGHGVLYHDPEPPMSLNPAVQPELQRIILTCLEKDKGRRFAHVVDLLGDLERLADVRHPRRRLTSGELAGRDPAPTGVVGPEGPASTGASSSWGPWGWIGAAAALVITAAAGLLSRGAVENEPPTTSLSFPIRDDRPSLAVMLFENRTGDPELNWMRSGLPELLLTDLGQSPDLELVESDRAYQILLSLGALDRPGASDSLVVALGEQSGAELVLAGSFVRAGEAFRVTASLHDAGTGQIIASESADAPSIDGIFAAVDTLAGWLRADLGLTARGRAALQQELSSVTTASPEAYRHYADALVLRYDGRVDEAIPSFVRALDLDPDFALALSKLSVLHALAGHDREARALSNRAMANLDRLPLRERYYVEGNHYSWHEEHYGRAIESYQRALELYPDHWPARHNLGSTYLDLELYEQALPLFALVAEGVPERVSSSFGLALCHLALGRPEAGDEILAGVALERPLARGAWLQLADFRVSAEDADGARFALERGGLAEDRLEFLDHMWPLMVLGRDWDALDAWEKGAELATEGYDLAHALFRRGIVALHRGGLEEGVRLLKASAEATPQPGRTSAFPHRLAAQALLETGDYAGAIATSEHAIRDGAGDQGEWAGLFVKAAAMARGGDVEGARAVANHLRNRTALVPGPKEERRYLHLLGEIALAEDDVETALSHLTSAERLLPPQGILLGRPAPPEHVPIWYSIARAHLAAHREDLAASYLRRIVQSGVERLYWPVEYSRSLALIAESSTVSTERLLPDSRPGR